MISKAGEFGFWDFVRPDSTEIQIVKYQQWERRVKWKK
jgi:hypothetical protein